ncbi:MAG: D-alanine--D-alanine ligase A [Clostridiales bacterium]|nr:MAG: D-alanine--D-alanine ligase A [Clostridiales bacterium]
MPEMTVAVLFGGASSEHEISLISATSVLNNIPREKYNVLCIGITKDGRWLWYDGPVDAITSQAWEQDTSLPTAVISPDRSHRGILKIKDGAVQCIPVDCIFPVLHGKNGEDGTVQGLFELSGIPYVGCGVIASANCMDKQVTHTMLDAAGIKTAAWRVLTKEERPRFDDFVSEFEQSLGYPMFVKPANAGSSVGISKARDRDELMAAVDLALTHDRKVIVEEMIIGTEIECAVLGNRNPDASMPGGITPCNDFYDYDAKYISEDSKLDIPANISPLASDLVKATAIKAYNALECTGLSRVDFFVQDNSAVILNEINTLPGFTSISMYPKLWDAEGLPYPSLIDRLIRLALERKEE